MSATTLTQPRSQAPLPSVFLHFGKTTGFSKVQETGVFPKCKKRWEVEPGNEATLTLPFSLLNTSVVGFLIYTEWVPTMWAKY